jgi:hypothetical protein
VLPVLRRYGPQDRRRLDHIQTHPATSSQRTGTTEYLCFGTIDFFPGDGVARKSRTPRAPSQSEVPTDEMELVREVLPSCQRSLLQYFPLLRHLLLVRDYAARRATEYEQYCQSDPRCEYHQQFWYQELWVFFQEYVSLSKSNILNVKITPVMYMSAVAIISYIIINTIREMIQMYQQKYMYFMDPINLVTWILYSAAIVMVLPIFWGTMYELQFSCASVTVFLSWFNLLLLLQRFDQVGIYVVMFLEILQTLIKVLMVFSILIIAFGLAFYILLSRVSTRRA